MRLNNEQYKALQPYEEHFKTMVRSKWARHPGSAALDIIHSVYVQVTGIKQKLNKGCSHCIMRLLSDMGRIFLTDDFEVKIKQGIEISPAEISAWSRLGIPLDVMTKTIIKVDVVESKKVVVKESLTTDPVKVEVKTKRKYTRKSKS